MSFDIAEYDGMVKLTVTHDELEAGGGMAKGIGRGWPITEPLPVPRSVARARPAM